MLEIIYNNAYFGGTPDSAYGERVYGEGMVWEIKFWSAALHLRYEFDGVKKGDLLVDFGGANGSQGLYFDRRGFNTVNVDISDWAARNSKVQGRHCQADVMSLPFAENTFPFAYCGDFLEHFSNKNVPVVLGEIRRVLKPGAQIVFVVVTGLEAGCLHETEADNQRKGHVTLYSRDKWREEILNAGFIIKRERPLTAVARAIGSRYPFRKIWFPTARDGLFIAEKA